jgi:hypothetical protein
MGFIDADTLEQRASDLAMNNYGPYLLRVLAEMQEPGHGMGEERRA